MILKYEKESEARNTKFWKYMEDRAFNLNETIFF